MGDAASMMTMAKEMQSEREQPPPPPPPVLAPFAHMLGRPAGSNEPSDFVFPDFDGNI